MTDLLAGIRYSMRALARAPVWTLTLILMMALGVGSRAAVQGFADGVMTSTLPIRAVEDVVTAFAIDPQGGSGPLPLEAFKALRARRDLFDSLGAIRESQERVTFDRQPMLLSVAFYTPEIATVLPLPPNEGVALSHRVRFAEFDSRTDPTGTGLRIGEQDGVVAASLPYWLEGLYRGRAVDLWVAGGDEQIGQLAQLWVCGRLRAGVSIDEAQAAIDRMNSASGQRIAVVAYTAQTPEAAAAMLRVRQLLTAAAGAVFLIACANVTAFLLARAYARARETAVRVAIGASRRQLIRQLTVDSVVISLLGGAAGLVVASWMIDVVPLLFFDQDAERLVFTPDTYGIVVTALVCATVTSACGLFTLIEARDDRPAAVLQREVAGPSKMMRRFRTALIVVQMAACATLVVSSGLLLEGFRAALETHAGRRLGDAILATVEAQPAATKNETTFKSLTYFDAVLATARSVTSVQDAIWAARLPGVRASWQWARFDPPRPEYRGVQADRAPLTAETLAHTEWPPVAGRSFTAFDAGECATAVLDEAAAKAWFTSRSVGRLIETPSRRLAEVIGVLRVRDLAMPTVFEHPETPSAPGQAEPLVFGIPSGSDLESGLIDVNVVSPNYFHAFDLDVVSGALFDARGRGCRIGVINEEAAARFFGGNAVGGGVIDAAGVRTEIVGVVRSTLLRTEQRRAEPTLFLPMTQDSLARMSGIFITGASDSSTVEALRTRIAQLPGGRPDRLSVTTLDDYLSRTALAPARMATVFVTLFATMALALGGLGLYGVMAESARRRRREFAVRLALGAGSWRVARQLMIEGLRLAAVGAAAGTVISLVVARGLATVTPTVGWPSLAVWLAAPILLAAAVAIASVVPAHRAASVDLLSLMRDME
jgi:ABC-type antimicrobial peptide transport system permease subunit